MSWLVPHAADVVSKQEVKQTGMTSHHYVKGRPYRGIMSEFGRQVLWYRPPSRGGIMDGRWEKGTWLGKSKRSDEHIIEYDGRIHMSRTIRHLPECDSWSLEALQAICATPWNHNPE